MLFQLKRLKLRKNNWESDTFEFDGVLTEFASQKRVWSYGEACCRGVYANQHFDSYYLSFSLCHQLLWSFRLCLIIWSDYCYETLMWWMCFALIFVWYTLFCCFWLINYNVYFTWCSFTWRQYMISLILAKTTYQGVRMLLT